MFLSARPPAAPLAAAAMPAIYAAGATVAAVVAIAAAAATLAPPILPPAHAEGPEPGTLAFQFGSPGDGPGELYRPQVVVMGPNGNIAVSDEGLAGGPSTQIFHPNGTFAFVLNKSYGFVDFAPNGNILVEAEVGDRSSYIHLHPDGTFAERLPDGGRGDILRSTVSVKYESGGVVSALYKNATVKVVYPNGSAFSWTLHDPEGILEGITYPDLYYSSREYLDYYMGPGNMVAVLDGYAVWVFHPDGTMPSKFGSYGIKPGEFLRKPNDLVFSPSGNILVRDGNGRVQAFHTNGTFVGFFSAGGGYLPYFGPSGEFIADATLYYPNGTLAARLGGGWVYGYIFSQTGEYILSAQTEAHKVAVFHGVNPAAEWQPSSLYEPPPDRGGGQGGGSGYMPPPPPGPPTAGSRFAFEIGSYGSGPGEFRWPDNVAFGPGGIVAVSDWGNNRVSVFHPNGTFAYAFGSSGHGPGEFNRPFGIAFGPNGLLAVTDVGNHRVQFFYLE